MRIKSEWKARLTVLIPSFKKRKLRFGKRCFFIAIVFCLGQKLRPLPDDVDNGSVDVQIEQQEEEMAVIMERLLNLQNSDDYLKLSADSLAHEILLKELKKSKREKNEKGSFFNIRLVDHL